jgi:hypothetical protein
MNAIDALVLMDTALFGGAKVVFVLELQNYFLGKMEIRNYQTQQPTFFLFF